MSRLGSMVGRSRSAVRAWERGESIPDNPAVIVALSAVLDLDQDGLFAAAGIPRPDRGGRPTVEEALATLQVDRQPGPLESSPSPPVASLQPTVGRAPTAPDAPAPPPVTVRPSTARRPISYLEDRGERTRYQLRVLATVVAVALLVLVLVWAFGEFREAAGAVWDSLRGAPSGSSTPSVTPGS